MKELFIIRGVPGSGKSTVANSLAPGAVCEADQYFIDSCTGEYKFDFKKLGLAHEFCRQKCDDFMKQEVPRIAVSNTNTTEKEFAPYVEMAQKYGYTVYFLIVEKRHDNDNKHGVPEEKVVQMGNRIKQNVKLYFAK